ncbi:MAG: hypothetical protein J5682_00340 [Prevotella sp.]|nr:hypothetical protein [Prevotella sp.]
MKYPKEFEEYWAANKRRLLQEDEEWRQATEAYQMKSGADWLLFGIPVVAGIVSMQYIPLQYELLRWVASISITIVVFALCVYVKSLTNPHRAIEDIESDVKLRAYEHFIQK